MMNQQQLSAAARERFTSGLNCAETVLLTLCEHWGIQSDWIPAIATPFGGGFAGTQMACGAMTGGLMAIGLCLGRQSGQEDRTPSYATSKEFMTWFTKEIESASCREITGMDLSVPEINAAFRAPGGKHDTVCAAIVEKVILRLAEMEPKK